MKHFYLIIISIFTLVSCNDISQKPNEEVMKNCLSDYFSEKIKIISYQQVDGLQKEKDGVKYYEGYFNAEIKFISNYEDFKVGDEYKILKGVLLFIKSERGWNCQEFDFSNSEFIILNKFEKSRDIIKSEQVTNTIISSKNENTENSELEIKEFVNNYYTVISNKDFNEFYNLFSPKVNFFGKQNLTIDEIIFENNNYQNKWPHYQVNIDTNSFDINSDGNYTNVDYRIFYKVKKKPKDNWKIFDLRMKMILDQNMKIQSINEYKQ